MAIITAPPYGLEIVPRQWIGNNATCDACRQDLSFTCINVGTASHTSDPRCNFIPLLGSDGNVSSSQLVAMERMLIDAFATAGQKMLVHGPDAVSYSPLAMALWLTLRYTLTLQQAYEWVLAKQPQAKDLSSLAPPRGP